MKPSNAPQFEETTFDKVDKVDLSKFSFDHKTKLTDWKNEPTVDDLLYDIRESIPTHNSQISKINEWVNLLYADTDKSKLKQGRSGIKPKVIRRLAEWRYGALSTSFLNEKKLFSVNATSPNYLDAAIQNELVLNYQFNALIDKVKFINDLVRAAVNEGTVIVRVGWERESQTKEKEIPVYEYIEAPMEQRMELVQLMQNIAQETQQGQLESSEDSPTFQQLPEEIQESIKASTEFGSPVVAIPTGEIQKIKEEVQTKNRPLVKVIPNSSLIIDPSCEGDFEQARFAVYIFNTSYSELKAAGIYKNLEKVFVENEINPASPSNLNTNFLGIDDNTFQRSNTNEIQSFQFKDKARKRVQAYEYWGYYDIDGTGIVQAIVATIVNNTIIRLERSPFPDNKLPFVVIPYLPIKGSVYGEPDAELVKDNQQVIQAVTRSIIDVQARSANGQVAIPKGYLDTINMNKFLSGENYQYNPSNMPPPQAIFTHVAPEPSQTALALLQQQYAETEAATGVKSFQGGLDGSAYGQQVAGMSQATTAMTQRESDIIYRLCKGLEKIGNKIVAMNGEWLNEEEVIAITQNDFIPIRREDLKGDFFLTVSVKSNSESEGKAQQLTFLAQTLGDSADWGLRKIFLMEICRLYNLDTMLNGIQNYEPQPDPVEEKRRELEIAKLEAEVAKIRAESEYFDSRGDFIQAQVDSIEADTDQKSLDFLQQQDGTKHRQQKEIVEAQAEAQNRGKVAQELIKGDNAARQARIKGEYTKEGNKSKPSSSGGVKVDPSTGRTFFRMPNASPKRSSLPYKINNGGMNSSEY